MQMARKLKVKNYIMTCMTVKPKTSKTQHTSRTTLNITKNSRGTSFAITNSIKKYTWRVQEIARWPASPIHLLRLRLDYVIMTHLLKIKKCGVSAAPKELKLTNGDKKINKHKTYE